jgi:Zn-dependent M28 family amino/carboxypeptidase
MGPIVRRAAAGMNIALSADPLPQEGLFTRSDHYRFVQEGVPSVFLMTGFAGEGEKQFKNFLATNYHNPKDDMNQPINWEAGAKFSRLNYLIAREIADAPEAPSWYSDSFFGQTFGKGQRMAKRPAE